jgi:hypothetical protein
MNRLSLLSNLVLVAGLCAVLEDSARAAATPMPGGSNQVGGVTGTLQSTLFNGKMRIRKMQLRVATAQEASPDKGESALTFSFIASNGTSKQRGGNFSAHLSDADGVNVDGRSVSVYSAYYSLIPAAAARGTIAFVLPSGYSPVKIVLVDSADDKEPVFRINLKPSDIPEPATAPAASASP